MKAVKIHEYGGLVIIKYEEVSRPEPGHGELFLRIHAAVKNTNPKDANFT
jgi:NADPH:quinone reductase-like Zn-dependent oxidoreductase